MLDLSDRPHLVEFVKDVAAMQAEEASGYLVIDCDDHGKVVPDMTPHLAKLLDESKLRSKIKNFVAGPFEFDALAGLVVIGERGSIEGGTYHPSLPDITVATRSRYSRCLSATREFGANCSTVAMVSWQKRFATWTVRLEGQVPATTAGRN